jgi:SAM-dependent methyltransferase
MLHYGRMKGADGERDRLVERYGRRKTWLYRILRPPVPVVLNTTEKGLPHTDGVRLWIGGAAQQVPVGYINCDIVNIAGVDVVASIEALPFRNDSVAAIECDAVLEHVRRADVAVKEMFRVLKRGGYLHVVVPFCHPLHLYPADYRRWSLAGLRELLSDFELVELGVRTGPTATLLTTVLEYVKIISPRPLRKPAYAICGWILWPLRYIDKYLNRAPDAGVLANSIYALVKKPSDDIACS